MLYDYMRLMSVVNGFVQDCGQIVGKNGENKICDQQFKNESKLTTQILNTGVSIQL